MINFDRFPPNSYMRTFKEVFMSPNFDIFLAVDFNASLYFITTKNGIKQVIKIKGNTGKDYAKREAASTKVIKWSPDNTKVAVIFDSEKPKKSLVIFELSKIINGKGGIDILAETYYEDYGMGIRDIEWDSTSKYIAMILHHEPHVYIWKLTSSNLVTDITNTTNIQKQEELILNNLLWKKTSNIDLFVSFSVQHTKGCGVLSWSPNREIICTGNEGGVIEIFELNKGKWHFLKSPDASPSYKTNYVRLLEWSDDNKYLFSVSVEYPNVVKVWNMELFELHHVSNIEAGSIIKKVVFNVKRNEYLVFDKGGIFTVFDIETGDKILDVDSDANVKDVRFEDNEVFFANEFGIIGRFILPNNSLTE